MKRERGPDGKWPLTPVLVSAQGYLRELTGERISQAEVQRLQCRLDAGDWPDQAARWVHAFFMLHDQASKYCANFEPGLPSQRAYDDFCSRSSFYADWVN